MGAIWADGDGGVADIAGDKARFDVIEYPAHLREARRVDHERLERYAAMEGVDVETFLEMVEARKAQITGTSLDET